MAQRQAYDSLQSSPRQAVQRQRLDTLQRAPSESVESKSNSAGGLPIDLRRNMGAMSGVDLDDVRVHRNSSKPAQLNALAYAQGSDIHLGPGQERHLPHEAWHVVQQAQGRVKPTLQMKQGVLVNDDAGLEHEADEMGRRAVSGVVQVARRDNAPASASPDGVVQRAVGFEFETGWFVDDIPIEGHGNDDDLEPRKPVPYRKKDVVSSATFDGFSMEADEAEGGRSEIEFVVRPPLEESPAGFKKLATVMEAMVGVGQGLKRFYNDDERSFPLFRVTGNSLDNYTLVTPRKGDPELKAGPQATTGLDLSVLAKATEVLDRHIQPDEIKVEHEEPSQDPPKFHGFLSLVHQYLARGTVVGKGALSYPKIIAEPLLARTNFVKLFKLVEPEIQGYYAKDHPELWVNDVLDKIGLPDIADVDVLARGVVAEDKLEEHTDFRRRLSDNRDELQRTLAELKLIGEDLVSTSESLATSKGDFLENAKRKVMGVPTKEALQATHERLVVEQNAKTDEYGQLSLEKDHLEEQKSALERYAGFTVRKWLDGLLSDTDLLSSIPDAESLGEFGERTEEVGPDGNKREAGIFEFRGAQATKIPVTQWPEFALQFFKKVLILHGHD
ncbi:hypothetical protein GCM10007898_45510 [Dyella flagellata]|uniref:eCIS core domain-containing protein n=2 Tax=Dyella flagellata TaxID=1867833 RepID=A0ABQ5XKF4_9GAMM|nr:hypothetical protein GCM10007898_45510 [Dyella flagellata]